MAGSYAHIIEAASDLSINNNDGDSKDSVDELKRRARLEQHTIEAMTSSSSSEGEDEDGEDDSSSSEEGGPPALKKAGSDEEDSEDDEDDSEEGRRRRTKSESSAWETTAKVMGVGTVIEVSTGTTLVALPSLGESGICFAGNES